MDCALQLMLSSENVFKGQERRIKEIAKASMTQEEFIGECQKFMKISCQETFKRVYWDKRDRDVM